MSYFTGPMLPWQAPPDQSNAAEEPNPYGLPPELQAALLASLRPSGPTTLPEMHPAHGFLDRFAMGLAGTQFPAINPHNSFGSQFAQGLVQGAAQGWSRNRVRPIINQQEYDRSMNLRNLQASDEARKYLQQVGLEGIKQKGADRRAKIAAGGKTTATTYQVTQADVASNPVAAAYIGQGVPVADAQRLGILPPSPTYADLHPKAADTDLTAEDLTMKTASNGARYVDVGWYPPKQQLQATRLAKLTGAVPLGKDESASVQSVQALYDNLDQILAGSERFLARTPMERPLVAARNHLAAATQTDPEIAAFGAFAMTAIPLLKAFGGKGSGFRMTQVEINLAMRNLPTIDDTYATATQKVKNLKGILGAAMNRMLPASGRPGGNSEPAKPDSGSWFDSNPPPGGP